MECLDLTADADTSLVWWCKEKKWEKKLRQVENKSQLLNTFIIQDYYFSSFWKIFVIVLLVSQ